MHDRAAGVFALEEAQGCDDRDVRRLL
jgi:hypothetical protein